MTERMSAPEALEWLQRAVATQGPEFVYSVSGRSTGCHYRPVQAYGESDPRSKTGCLIGTAMVLAGREIHPEMEGRSVMDGFCILSWNLSGEAARVLATAQWAQDNGKSWGEALAAAITFAGEE